MCSKSTPVWELFSAWVSFQELQSIVSLVFKGKQSSWISAVTDLLRRRMKRKMESKKWEYFKEWDIVLVGLCFKTPPCFYPRPSFLLCWNTWVITGDQRACSRQVVERGVKGVKKLRAKACSFIRRGWGVDLLLGWWSFVSDCTFGKVGQLSTSLPALCASVAFTRMRFSKHSSSVFTPHPPLLPPLTLTW